ncbi:MAG: ImmA/IrrE family metallo-endopeptidase [Deltaproteobacteria bacterium]|nr:ImmA/IrrE family metallo-endopeptidase [Deltaproteobacteria bacterium]
MTIDLHELGRRLREARNACGLSQEVVANQLGISRTSLTQIENGNRNVGGLELDQLARLYGRAIQDFLQPDFSADQGFQAFFRLNPEFATNEERFALQNCIALAREITALERLLDIEVELGTSYELGSPRSRGEAIVHGNRVAEEERRRLSLGDAPIMNLRELLETEGVRTAALVLPLNVSGLTLFGADLGRFVAVQKHDVPLRQRFSLAHEYAHVVMDSRGPGRVSRKREEDNIEIRANAFAAAFLLPEIGVRDLVASLGSASHLRAATAQVFNGDEGAVAASRDGRSGYNIGLLAATHVAQHYGVSRLAAIYRMHNIGLFGRDQLDKLVADERAGKGSRLARVLGLSEDSEDQRLVASTQRLQLLGIEAVRRDLISRRKFIELLELAGMSLDDAEEFVYEACEDPSEEINGIQFDETPF